MQSHHDIYEVLPDGRLLWKASVDGQIEGIQKLTELAKGQKNEFRLIHLASKMVVASLNTPTA